MNNHVCTYARVAQDLLASSSRSEVNHTPLHGVDSTEKSVLSTGS